MNIVAGPSPAFFIIERSYLTVASYFLLVRICCNKSDAG
jgi:hypothetical protein